MSEQAGEPAKAPSVELWNPAAAVNWSLPFTVAFGAYIQHLNWVALGEPDRARASKNWFYGTFAFILATMFVPIGAARLAGLVFLLAWYTRSGKKQMEFVKEKFGDDYARKGWGKPILIACCGFVALLVVSFILGLVLAIATGSGGEEPAASPEAATEPAAP